MPSSGLHLVTSTLPGGGTTVITSRDTPSQTVTPFGGESQSKSKPKTAMIVGIVLGVLALVTLLFFIFFCRHRLRNQRNRRLGTFNRDLMVRQTRTVPSYSVPPTQVFANVIETPRSPADYAPAAQRFSVVSSNATITVDPQEEGDYQKSPFRGNEFTPTLYSGIRDSVASTGTIQSQATLSTLSTMSYVNPLAPRIITTPATPPQNSLLFGNHSLPSPPHKLRQTSTLGMVPSERIGSWTDKQVEIHEKILKLQAKITEMETVQDRK